MLGWILPGMLQSWIRVSFGLYKHASSCQSQIERRDGLEKKLDYVSSLESEKLTPYSE